MPFNPNPKPYRPKPFRSTESYPQPRRRANPWTPYRATPSPLPKEEKPYWTAKQWEEWAENEFINNEDAVNFLPEWFIEAMEEEEE